MKVGALRGFVDDFVVPLLAGGKVAVGRPYEVRDRDRMLADDASPLAEATVSHALLRRGQLLVADPPGYDPSSDDLSLWLALHNILSLDHPDVDRVWTRSSMWDRVESETRILLAVARPRDMSESFARHLSVGSFLALEREDHIVVAGEVERRHIGQRPPARRLQLFAPRGEERSEVVRWIHQPHSPATARLLSDLLWISPLTCLLAPEYAPGGWSPLMAVDFLHSRGSARAVCYAWARAPDWLQTGAIVAGSLLAALGEGVAPAGEATRLPLLSDLSPAAAPRAIAGVSVAPRPGDVAAVVAALIHLHFLKVLDFDARIGAGAAARDRAVQAFLALPLLLPRLDAALGSPWGDAEPEPDRLRRWEEYRAHLRSLLPADVVANLLATFTLRIVETSVA